MMRIGLVGCGTHGRQAVVPAIQQFSSRSVLTAVADPNPQATDTLGDVPRFESLPALLAACSADVIYISTLLETHAALVRMALLAGRHVVCEKPLAPSAAICRELVDVAQSVGRHLFVNFETRYHAPNQRVRAWIDAGLLGTVEAIHLQQFWDGHKAFGPGADRRARLMAEIGALDCGIHKLDLARFLGGGAAWQELWAQGAWFGEKMPYPPHLSVLGRLSPDILVTVTASMGYAAQITPRPMLETLVVAGDRGVVSVAVEGEDPDAFHASGARVRLASAEHQEQFDYTHPQHAEAIGLLLDDVAAVVLDGRPVSPQLATGEDGFQSQWAAERANAMARNRRSVPSPAGPADLMR